MGTCLNSDREPDHYRRLIHLVRPEFRASVIVPEPGDPVFSKPLCAVDGCPRSSYLQRLCLTHWKQWNRSGRPELSHWLVSARPVSSRGRVPRPCQGAECDREAGGLSGGQAEADKRFEPQLEQECAVSGCEVPACRGGEGLCLDHRTYRRVVGSPPLDDFLLRCATNGEPRFDLRALPPLLRLEIQYALQCRADKGRVLTRPRPLKPLMTALAVSGVDSLLECSSAQWLVLMRGKGATAVTRAFLNYALDELARLGDGVGWERVYPLDSWHLRSLGLPTARPARLEFGSIHPQWLRDLAKHYARWRICSGISPARIRREHAAIVHMSELTPALSHCQGPEDLGSTALAEYVVALRAAELSAKTRYAEAGAVFRFLRSAEQHGWAPALALDDELALRSALLPGSRRSASGSGLSGDSGRVADGALASSPDWRGLPGESLCEHRGPR
jgi:hypothetical protein